MLFRSLMSLPESARPLLLDVRTPEEFAAGKFPGAINIPLDELEGYLPTIPKDKTLVFT